MRNESLEDRRIILRHHSTSSRGHQRLASADHRLPDLSRSTRRLDRSARERHVATRSRYHPCELSARVYLFPVARHPTGKPVGSTLRNRKTVSRLDNDRLRGRFRGSTRVSAMSGESRATNFAHTGANQPEQLTRISSSTSTDKFLRVLWRLASSGGGKTSIYLPQGLLGAAISPLHVVWH